MKGRRALRRIRRTRASGFTLMELMVVVVLIAVMAALATPALSTSRNDRVAFDYARQYQQVIQRARARAAGTGAAHLALLGPGSGSRGYVRIFAALDGTTTAGPNPVSSCKGPAQWNDAAVDPLVTTSNTARFIDFADINRSGINVDMDVKAELSGTGLNVASGITIAYIAICMTPSGVTYAGAGDTALVAIANMQSAPAFTGIAEAAIQRHFGGAGVGIKRRVVITGGGAPRVRSE